MCIFFHTEPENIFKVKEVSWETMACTSEQARPKKSSKKNIYNQTYLKTSPAMGEGAVLSVRGQGTQTLLIGLSFKALNFLLILHAHQWGPRFHVVRVPLIMFLSQNKLISDPCAL